MNQAYLFSQIVVKSIIFLKILMHSEFTPNSEQISTTLIAQGIEPNEGEEPNSYFQRALDFVMSNPHLRNEDRDYYIKNRKSIQQNLKKKIKDKHALVAIGHAGKWVSTMYSMILAAAAKAGSSSLNVGWAKLIQLTGKTTPSQLVSLTFTKTIFSKTTWIVSIVVCSLQIGWEFKKYCCNQVTGKQFFENCSKIIVTQAVSTVGFAGGAALGVYIGSLLGPVGSIAGGIIGGIIGGVASCVATDMAYDKYQSYTAKKLYQQALTYFELDKTFSDQELEHSRKCKYMLYHPDKWIKSDEKTQQKKKKSLAECHQYYEIIINWKGSK